MKVISAWYVLCVVVLRARRYNFRFFLSLYAYALFFLSLILERVCICVFNAHRVVGGYIFRSTPQKQSHIKKATSF